MIPRPSGRSRKRAKILIPKRRRKEAKKVMMTWMGSWTTMRITWRAKDD
jgi:hypothetical protein